MWSVNVMSLLLFCYACLSVGDSEVHFVSRNFYNVLEWDPVEPAFPGQKVLYSVHYHKDSEQKYRMKKECQNMTDLSCNLTQETPSVYDVHYRAKVCVNDSSCRCTTRFKPLRDTVLDAPTLSINTAVTGLHVKVTLPLGPNGVSIADIIGKSKNWLSKTEVLYTLKITNPEWAAQEFKNTTGQFDINLKYNQTLYCGYVVYKPASEWGCSDSEEARFCARLPDDHRMFLQWPLMGVAVLAAMSIISVVCMYSYVKGGKTKNMPQGLVTTSKTYKMLQHPDKNLILSELQVCTQSDHTVYATIQVKPNVPSQASGGYFPQDIPCHVCLGSSNSFEDTGAHRDSSAQSSEIYSAVVVHVQPEKNGDFQQAASNNGETSCSFLSSKGEESCDSGGMTPKLTSREAPPLPDFDACEINLNMQLVLNTVRNITGQLVLPPLTLQLQSNVGDIVSPMNERKPLLSDLTICQDGPSLASLQSFDSSEWADSGYDESSVNTPTSPHCNQHYSHSQLVPDFQQGCQTTLSGDAIIQSGYKQNWLPELHR
ncbi:interferon lambda receptor 1 [Odontesthes bonariensis]|uniref:interferon lambda receptor 1 n=1 Tax=Odontesthes bonariensis TaxID=219752 RepID=UPI003F58C68A